jgi:hypothetical protein
VIERFDRNPSIPANEDVYERRFNLNENTIKLIYHREESCITASTREFELPSSQGDQAFNLTFHPDMTSGYQVDPYVKSPKNRVLYDTLENLVMAQEQTCAKARQSEQEVKEILDARTREEARCVLGISVYDVARNETAKKHRIELERKQAEEERLRKEKEMDYLAPYLARLGEPDHLTFQDKQQLKEDCLRDLRVQLVDIANIIQKRFEEETSSLQKKQQWYQDNQQSFQGRESKEEDDYIEYCREAMFRIHILERRLMKHKSIAPQKYREMEERLRTDPRLSL